MVGVRGGVVVVRGGVTPNFCSASRSREGVVNIWEAERNHAGYMENNDL